MLAHEKSKERRRKEGRKESHKIAISQKTKTLNLLLSCSLILLVCLTNPKIRWHNTHRCSSPPNCSQECIAHRQYKDKPYKKGCILFKFFLEEQNQKRGAIKRQLSLWIKVLCKKFAFFLFVYQAGLPFQSCLHTWEHM